MNTEFINLLNEGIKYENIKDYVQSEIYYRAALSSTPQNPEGIIALGRVLIKSGKYAEARNVFAEDTNASDSTYTSEILYGLGHTEAHLGNHKAAAQAFRQSLNGLRKQNHPLLPDALYGLGLAEYKLGNHYQAIEALEQAVSERYLFEPAWKLLTHLLFRSGRWSRLLRIYLSRTKEAYKRR